MKDSKNLLKKFVSYYKPHIRIFALDLMCAFFIALIDLAFPMVTRYAVNDLIPNKEYRLFFIIVIVLLIIYGIRAVFEYIVNYWGHILGLRIEFEMRNDLFKHLQTLSFKFYDKNRTGKIMSRVINDLFEMTELAHHGPEDLFLSCIMLVGSFILLLNIEWRLAVIVYIFVPILLLFASKQRMKMRNGFKEVKQKVSLINAELESSISGIRVSKSFANEEYEMEKFNKGNLSFRGSKNQALKNMAVFMSGINILSSILNIIVLIVGGYFIMLGRMNSGDLIAFILYVNYFMQPIKRLSNFAQQFESGMSGFERFCDLMDEKSDIVEKENAIKLNDVQGDIIFNNITFSYDDKDNVLTKINLKISAGKTLALVGPSGGGKTTLCHLIPRFYEAQAGEITIDGHNVKDLSLNSLRSNIGIVQQDVFLFATTIRDNIMYGKIDATEDEMIEAAKNANIHDFIMSLPNGYDTNVGERGIRLSGGQKQRISIARVFLKNPPILLLDEATSALDNETELKIQQALEKLSIGRTTLVIAHRLSTIKHADDIVVITSEGIKEEGNHEELIKKDGIYSRLYKAQFKGYIPDEA